MKSRMLKEEIFEKLAETLSNMLKIPIDRIKMNTTLTNELGIDSLDFFDIVVRISETFDLKIGIEEELPPLNVVGDVVDFIESKFLNLEEKK